MKDISLVILAAGMGSRFGGLKQIEPVGPNNEFIIDYSIYDAIKAGVTKVVFIIKKENLDVFRETIGKRIESKVKVEYAFQDLNLKNYKVPENRIKPFGTTHALLCARKYINEPFILINADDFYGQKAYEDAVKFLKNTNYEKNGLVLYPIENTLSKNGRVKRGICKLENDKIINVVESYVSIENNEIHAESITNSNEKFIADNNCRASMNMFILLPEIFDLLENKFNDFLENNKNDLSSCEALILDDIFSLYKKGLISFESIYTSSKWYGLTFKEDKEEVIKNIENEINLKNYPKNLWQ